ncbi:hypothetical protein PYW07_008191 [Mythimna separata]|uniref:Acyltransferase 3 domain-containing protein n=1 Tax=Mythimna separata TaxID=271217 RepID=A0AAD7YC76_MYTSE|nr:hypothetical protein PYW07_008191 [Mythimna separata]
MSSPAQTLANPGVSDDRPVAASLPGERRARARRQSARTMAPTHAHALCALALLAAAAASDIIFDLSDEQYYSMPQLFALDAWPGCVAARAPYCVGTFEITPEKRPHPLFDVMQRYSANSVDNFNHTRLHRGLCLPRSCAQHAPARAHALPHDQLRDWYVLSTSLQPHAAAPRAVPAALLRAARAGTRACAAARPAARLHAPARAHALPHDQLRDWYVLSTSLQPHAAAPRAVPAALLRAARAGTRARAAARPAARLHAPARAHALPHDQLRDWYVLTTSLQPHAAAPRAVPAALLRAARAGTRARAAARPAARLTSAAYNLSASLLRLEYCSRGAAPAPLSASEQAFVALLAVLLALSVVSTALEIVLPDHAKKGAEWALSWSIPSCWRALHAPPPSSSRTDLTSFDGLRVLTMLVVIIEHVCWITTQTYLTDTKIYEQIRGSVDVVLMTNSTLVVQIFFIMSSFLLAHKLLQQRRRGESVPPFSTFVETMVNRIIRVSPSYWVVVWFAASWWERLGRGPMWAPLVASEAAVCRRKWWTHLLYLNNILQADDKCLIQTWYLAADMQLYALCLVLTLALWRWRRAALAVLTGLLLASVALLFGLAYSWQLVPTYVMHRPESVRLAYKGESSFNVLYQSPLGNVPGALAGLLLAHLQHALLDMDVQLPRYKVRHAQCCVLLYSTTCRARWRGCCWRTCSTRCWTWTCSCRATRYVTRSAVCCCTVQRAGRAGGAAAGAPAARAAGHGRAAAALQGTSRAVLCAAVQYNVPGALAGLLLAHLQHALLDMDVQLPRYKVRHAQCCVLLYSTTCRARWRGCCWRTCSTRCWTWTCSCRATRYVTRSAVCCCTVQRAGRAGGAAAGAPAARAAGHGRAAAALQGTSRAVLCAAVQYNVPGALAGLLLAHLQHALLDMDVQLPRYKVRHAQCCVLLYSTTCRARWRGCCWRTCSTRCWTWTCSCRATRYVTRSAVCCCTVQRAGRAGGAAAGAPAARAAGHGRAAAALQGTSRAVLCAAVQYNVPGALAGLLLAHLQHALLDMDVQLPRYKVRHAQCCVLLYSTTCRARWRGCCWRTCSTRCWTWTCSCRATRYVTRSAVCCLQAPLSYCLPFLLALDHGLYQRPAREVFGWISVASVPVAAWWVAASPLALGRGPPGRLAAAALAALERPVFSFFVAMALLGAMNNIPSAVQRFLSWRGWASWARLSFGALLLHMPINKSLVAARLMPSMLDRQSAILEWFGVAAVSYMTALPLALLVELPAQRLHRALSRRPAARAPAPPPPAADKPTDKADL